MWGHPESLTCGPGCQIFVKACKLLDVCILDSRLTLSLICGPCVSQDMAGSMCQGHQGIKFRRTCPQPLQTYQPAQPLRLPFSAVQCNFLDRKPPHCRAHIAVPSSGGLQSEDALVFIDGGVQGGTMLSCNECNAEGCIGGGGSCEGSGGGGGVGVKGGQPRCSAGVQDKGRRPRPDGLDAHGRRRV